MTKVVASEEEAWEEETERVLKRGGGEVKTVDLEEIWVVEAVAEEAAAAQREEIERDVLERRRERRRLRRGSQRRGGGRSEEATQPAPARRRRFCGFEEVGLRCGNVEARGGGDGVEGVDDGGDVSLREGACVGVEGGVGGRGGERRRG